MSACISNECLSAQNEPLYETGYPFQDTSTICDLILEIKPNKEEEFVELRRIIKVTTIAKKVFFIWQRHE